MNRRDRSSFAQIDFTRLEIELVYQNFESYDDSGVTSARKIIVIREWNVHQRQRPIVYYRSSTGGLS